MLSVIPPRVSALAIILCVFVPAALVPAAAEGDLSPDTALSEAKASLTLRGQPASPRIFGELGDGWLSDSDPTIVAIDLRTAIGSNRFAGVVEQADGWRFEKITRPGTDPEEFAYKRIGSTPDGLLLVLTRYSGGGTGIFFTLHVEDLRITYAFEPDGAATWRLTMTDVRAIPLGDRWQGTIDLAGRTALVRTKVADGTQVTRYEIAPPRQP